MPWRPTYTQETARVAIARASSWTEVLSELGLAYHGKNIATTRRWAERWGIDVSHLATRGAYRYSEDEARDAIVKSLSWAEAMRRLGYCDTGANYLTLKKRAIEWGITWDHFDPHASSRDGFRRGRIPLSEILVSGSKYKRDSLKRRLYKAGLKQPTCEICGQGETWRGKRMSLILDHVNGVRDDNRLENLQVVCPNCAATLETHCGRSARINRAPKACLHCGEEFVPKSKNQRYCSSACGSRWERKPTPRPAARKVERPRYEQLLAEIKRLGYSAVSRKYGVSDNAIRKWVKQYERERAVEEGRDPDLVETPARTWPNQLRLDEAA